MVKLNHLPTADMRADILTKIPNREDSNSVTTK